MLDPFSMSRKRNNISQHTGREKEMFFLSFGCDDPPCCVEAFLYCAIPQTQMIVLGRVRPIP